MFLGKMPAAAMPQGLQVFEEKLLSRYSDQTGKTVLVTVFLCISCLTNHQFWCIIVPNFYDKFALFLHLKSAIVSQQKVSMLRVVYIDCSLVANVLFEAIFYAANRFVILFHIIMEVV